MLRSEHRLPFAAFLLVTALCAAFVVRGLPGDRSPVVPAAAPAPAPVPVPVADQVWVSPPAAPLVRAERRAPAVSAPVPVATTPEPEPAVVSVRASAPPAPAPSRKLHAKPRPHRTPQAVLLARPGRTGHAPAGQHRRPDRHRTGPRSPAEPGRHGDHDHGRHSGADRGHRQDRVRDPGHRQHRGHHRGHWHHHGRARGHR